MRKSGPQAKLFPTWSDQSTKTLSFYHCREGYKKVNTSNKKKGKKKRKAKQSKESKQMKCNTALNQSS